MAGTGTITLNFPNGTTAVGTLAAGAWTWVINQNGTGQFPPGYQPGNAGAFPNATVNP
jgi:hypothetical protein